MSMALTTKRKQEGEWLLEFSRDIAKYRDAGWSCSRYMEFRRLNLRAPNEQELAGRR